MDNAVMTFQEFLEQQFLNKSVQIIIPDHLLNDEETSVFTGKITRISFPSYHAMQDIRFHFESGFELDIYSDSEITLLESA